VQEQASMSNSFARGFPFITRAFSERRNEPEGQILRKALEAAPFPAMLLRADGRIILMSDAVCRLTGYERSEIPTLDEWLNTVCADREEAQELRREFERVARSNGLIRLGERTVWTRWGEERIWEGCAIRFGEDSDGVPLLLYEARDVTDERYMVRLLHQSGQILVGALSETDYNMLAQTCLEAAIDLTESRGGLMVMSNGGDTLRAWYCCRDGTGRKQGCVDGFDVGGALKRVLLSNEPVICNMGVEEAWAEIFPEKISSLLAVPVSIRGRAAGLVGVINRKGGYADRHRDALERIARLIYLVQYHWRAQEAIRKMNEELERANRELKQFAYIASHDLQEPLRKISGFSSLLAKRYSGKLDKDADEFIGFIKQGCEQMQRLIDDLLALSRVSRGQVRFERVNLKEIAMRIAEDENEKIKAMEGTIEVGDLPEVEADPVQMWQILKNLIGNAVKFRHPDRAPRVEVFCQAAGNEWRIGVRDNGIGIEPEYQEKIFEAFRRLHSHRRYSGTGIGLAICRKIAQRHGGRIWVESEPGRGSTFFFTLPRSRRCERQ